MAVSSRVVKGMKLIAVGMTALFAFSFVMSVGSTVVSASLFPLVIDGHVYDPSGNPLEGAEVSVSIYNGETWINTYTTTTDVDGFYTQTITPADWDVGFKIVVQATYNSEQISDSVIAEDVPDMTVDLQFPLGIPQFGTLIGFFVAAGLVAVVAVVFLTKKR